ncbi:MAG: ABC-F family ATP-binding cassette domain-containing protein, partial [Phormidesmis sp.]
MSLITFQSVYKDFGIKEVLRDGSFSIEPDDKVGVIGVNGSGKSTLLKMMGGMEPIDKGQRLTKSGARLVYLPQQPDIDENLTVLDQVFADCGEQMQLVREYETLSHKMSQAQGKTLDSLMNRLATVGEQMETSGAWELETNAKIILTKLGIEDFEARVGDLSGGYRKRIALATALLSDPDLLLMDEPTNHLDAESVEWLQDYLAQFRGALVLITHDRYFLDKVTNRIIEIDRADLYTYAGSYAYYLEKKADQEASSASSQQKFKGMLRRELAWLRQGPKARSTKQNARIQRIDEMKEKSFKETQGKVEIDTAGRRIGKKVIELEGISKSFDNRVLIKDFTYEFTASDRIGIIGGNGAGKSTLMNIITGKLEPDEGTVEIGQTIHIGYFNQHSEELIEARDENQRVMDYLKEEGSFVTTADGSQISVSQMLERFLFTSNQQYTP